METLAIVISWYAVAALLEMANHDYKLTYDKK
jgi:hypothetical protein